MLPRVVLEKTVLSLIFSAFFTKSKDGDVSSFFRIYLKYGSPVKMMESYISVLTKGICQSEENGSFLSKDFDVRKAYLAGSVKGGEKFIFHNLLLQFKPHALKRGPDYLLINSFLYPTFSMVSFKAVFMGFLPILIMR